MLCIRKQLRISIFMTIWISKLNSSKVLFLCLIFLTLVYNHATKSRNIHCDNDFSDINVKDSSNTIDAIICSSCFISVLRPFLPNVTYNTVLFSDICLNCLFYVWKSNLHGNDKKCNHKIKLILTRY